MKDKDVELLEPILVRNGWVAEVEKAWERIKKRLASKSPNSRFAARKARPKSAPKNNETQKYYDGIRRGLRKTF